MIKRWNISSHGHITDEGSTAKHSKAISGLDPTKLVLLKHLAVLYNNVTEPHFPNYIGKYLNKGTPAECFGPHQVIGNARKKNSNSREAFLYHGKGKIRAE